MDTDSRNKITELVLQAYTLEECLRAEEQLQAYLHDKPEDWPMYDLVTMLATIKQAAEKDSAPQIVPVALEQGAAVH